MARLRPAVAGQTHTRVAQTRALIVIGLVRPEHVERGDSIRSRMGRARVPRAATGPNDANSGLQHAYGLAIFHLSPGRATRATCLLARLARASGIWQGLSTFAIYPRYISAPSLSTMRPTQQVQSWLYSRAPCGVSPTLVQHPRISGSVFNRRIWPVIQPAATAIGSRGTGMGLGQG